MQGVSRERAYVDISARGIYAIINKITGVWYIGMTTVSFKNRWMHHTEDLLKGEHHNRALQRDFNTYGQEAYVFRILETIRDQQIIPVREKYYIAAYSDIYPLFNVKDNPRWQVGEKDEQKRRALVSS